METLLAQDELMKNLSLIQAHLSDMKSKVDDALLVSGNWLFGATRSIYAVLKTPAACTRMPERQDALKQRFARPAKKKGQPPEVASARGPPFLFLHAGLDAEETEKKGPLMALQVRHAG